MRAIRASITALNLEFLIADILKEQRNPASTTSKRIYVHRVNRTSKDLTYQSKGPKYIESSKLFNRRRKSNRSSNYNIYLKENEKVLKDIETKLKSDPDLKLKSFTYVIKNFDLDNNKSNCFIGSLNFRNSVKDFEIEGGYLTTFNRSKKLLKRSPNKSDLLLYDINTIDHIVNDRKWFRDDYTLNRGQLRTLKTGGEIG